MSTKQETNERQGLIVIKIDEWLKVLGFPGDDEWSLQFDPFVYNEVTAKEAYEAWRKGTLVN